MEGWRETERRAVVASRGITIFAVVASIAGALLTTWLGLVATFEAFASQVSHGEGRLPAEELAIYYLVSALDRFLLAIVLLYFGYGVYALFLHPRASAAELGLPRWLRVESIGQLKQTLAEVILVVLFVLFMRVALETFVGGAGLTPEQLPGFLALPLATLLLAAALKLAELHPKPRQSQPKGDDEAGG